MGKSKNRGKNSNAKNDNEYTPLGTKSLNLGKNLFKKWTKEENILYAEYLKNNLIEILNLQSRVSHCFFIKMAEELRIGKNNLQCRSHHQKMLKKYYNL